MDNLKYIFDQVNEWIRTADQKAMILGSFNMAGFIYQLINIDKIMCAGTYAIVVFILSIIATLVALRFWLLILYPRLNNDLKISKIYFSHIANAYEHNKYAGIENLQNMTPDEFKKDLSSQIIENSIIAKKKYQYIQKFIFAFIAQIITLILVLSSMV
jgi:hypothetical protein